MLMAAMFRSLRDAFVVVLTVPVALVGGVLGLRVLGAVAFQPLDLLTMIGFIMMVGVIVNHSILLVDRTRDAQNHGHSLEESIRLALNQRLRAILASTLTGALGALPMAVNPGPGSVIYRGLAAVNVGGVVVAMVFSLLLLPSLMRLTTPRQKALAAPARRAGTGERGRARRVSGCDESNGVSDAQQNVSVAAALALLPRRFSRPAPKREPAKAPEPPPTVVEVAKADIAHIAPRHWAPGSVVSRDDAKLATSAAGRLVYVAEVGTRLKAGEQRGQARGRSDSPAARRCQDRSRAHHRAARARRAHNASGSKNSQRPTALPPISSTRRARRSCSWLRSCARSKCAFVPHNTISNKPKCMRRFLASSANASRHAANTSRRALRSRIWSTRRISKRKCRRRWRSPRWSNRT